MPSSPRAALGLLAPALLALAGCAAEDYYQAGRAWEGRQPLAALEYYRLAAEAGHPEARAAAEDLARPALAALAERRLAREQSGDAPGALGLLDQEAALRAVLQACEVSVPAGELERSYPAALRATAAARFAQGEQLRTRGEAKQASIAYREALACDPDHAEARARYTEQRAQATQRLAIVPFSGAPADLPLAGRELADAVTATALARQPEFLRFVDRVNLDRLLDELDLNETGLVDPATAARQGKLLGVTALLLGEVHITCDDPGWQRLAKHADGEVSVDDGKGGKRKEQRSADYAVSERLVEVRATVNYRILSAETGEVLAAANGLSAKVGDKVRYARLIGGEARVVPSADRALLDEAEREPRPREQLTRSALESLAQVVAKDLVERFP